MRQTDNPDSGLPDFEAVNGIPIYDVARKIGPDLGVEVGDGKIRCPQAGEHKPGAYPFLEILRSNRVICRACGTCPMSVVDMLHNFGGLTLIDAGVCVAAYGFNVPRIPKGIHLKNPSGEPVPPGCLNPWTLLISTGVWRELSEPAKALVPIFLHFAGYNDGGEIGEVTTSYGALQQYAGLRSPNAVSKALKELAEICWLEKRPAARGGSPINGVTTYRITPLSQGVIDKANSAASLLAARISHEKAIRKQKRRDRERKFLSK